MNKEKLTEEIEKLLHDKVWVTKKSRMEAEARLKLNNIVSDILINYYTFFIVAISIWSLVLNDKTAHNITIITIVISVGLFGLTLFLSSIGFKQKALQFKESYHKLDDLEIDIKYLLRKVPSEQEKDIIIEFNKLEKKYINILSLTDNHDNIDYQKVILSRRLKNLDASLKNSYRLKITLKWFFIIFIFFIPIILIMIF